MSRPNRVVAVLVLGAITVGVAVIALVVSPRPSAVPGPTGIASPTANATVAPSASPTAAGVNPSPTARGTHENLVLGYRITLPERYRRVPGGLITAPGDALGGDFYTITTEQEARDACLQDAGHIPQRQELPALFVSAWRNPLGMSAHEWATTPRVPGGGVRSLHQKVEATTIGGHEAVRLVQDNATAATTAFVVRARDRMYEIGYGGVHPGSELPRDWLDGMARTFVAITPDPFPTATPTVAPQVGAGDVARSLAAAFAAKDADAVARLMIDCWISVVYAIDGEVPGQGGLNRSTYLFTTLLRGRFAAGDLRVSVDPSLQQGTLYGPDTHFVRSDWREPDRTVRIDLVLSLRDGRWLWTGAVHQYTAAQRGCIPYRSPWVSGTGGC